MLLVVAYWRTNLTLRQLAPLFGVSKPAAARVIDHLGPLLAFQPRRRFAKGAVLIVDGTLVPTRDHTIAERSKTSHVAGRSSRRSGGSLHGCREGTIGVEWRAVLQAVVPMVVTFPLADTFLLHLETAGGRAGRGRGVPVRLPGAGTVRRTRPSRRP